MASQKLISVAGGGLRPPTALTARLSFWSGGSSAHTVLDELGCQQSSPITSATLTSIVNESVGGVLTFAALHAATGSTTTDSKFRIIINGNTVLDDTGDAISSAYAAKAAVGSICAPSGAIGFSEGIVPYDTLEILIAGDGTNGVQSSHKLYSTG